MNKQERFYDTMNAIRDRIPEEKFTKLMDNFVAINDISNESIFAEYNFHEEPNDEMKKDLANKFIEANQIVLEAMQKYKKKNLKKVKPYLREQIKKNPEKTEIYDMAIRFFKEIAKGEYNDSSDEEESEELKKCSCDENQMCWGRNLLGICDCRHYPEFIKINPHIALFYEDKKIEYTKEPIMYPRENFQDICKNFVILNKMNNIINDCEYDLKIKLAITSALFDYSMRNLFHLKMQPKETIFDIFQIQGLLQNDDVIEFFKKQEFDPNIWIKAFKNKFVFTGMPVYVGSGDIEELFQEM